MRRLTESEKKQIVQLRDMGFTSRKISEVVLGTPTRKSTVNDFLRGLEEDVMTYPHMIKGWPKRSSQGFVDNSRILNISDMHIPYHHKDTIPFLKHLKQKYNPTRVISLGDECFPGHVEIMTTVGWKTLKEYCEQYEQGFREEILSVDDNLEGFMVVPERVVNRPSNQKLLRQEHKTFVSITTPKHNMVRLNPATGSLHRREAWDDFGISHWTIPRSVVQSGEGCGLGQDEMRLLAAFQADGTFTKGAVRFGFSKQRKADRLEQLLNELDIPYNTHTVARGDYQYYIEKANVPNYLDKMFSEVFDPFSMTEGEKNTLIDEISYWDSAKKSDRFRYTTCIKENIEFIQTVGVLCGRNVRKIGEYVPSQEGHSKAYYLDFITKKSKTTLRTATKSEVENPEGRVYCVTVPTGMILTRQEGWVSVSGNCDKHALSYHDSDPDLPSAGDELRKSLPVFAELKQLFPKMDVLESNHGSLVWRKAKTHGVPRHYLKSYNDVLGVDDQWQWHFDLTVDLPNGMKCYYHHGKSADVLKLSQQMGMCAVQGHYHERFKIDYWGNPTGLYWALQSGCLIDDDSYAFAYNNVNIKRPIIGTSVIIDGYPTLEPMVLNKSGNWRGY